VQLQKNLFPFITSFIYQGGSGSKSSDR